MRRERGNRQRLRPPRRLKTFKANEAFQKRIRESGVKDHVPTKIVTLKVRLGDGETRQSRGALVSGGKNQGRVKAN